MLGLSERIFYCTGDFPGRASWETYNTSEATFRGDSDWGVFGEYLGGTLLITLTRFDTSRTIWYQSGRLGETLHGLST